MGLIERNQIISQIAPPLDSFLATQLVDEFISLERRFIQRDWEPAELDGGQFAEIAARIVYHMDANNLSLVKDFGDCMKYIEDEKSSNSHGINPRSDALHLAKVLRTVYKFRSVRGAVHISPSYTPNQMDAKFILESVRWCMNEILRVFWMGDREKVAKAIREILQFEVPAIGIFENKVLVQRTDLTAEEEILILLHFAGEIGYTRTELGRHTKRDSSLVTKVLKKLCSPEKRQIIEVTENRYRLTDLGSNRVRVELAAKLLAH